MKIKTYILSVFVLFGFCHAAYADNVSQSTLDDQTSVEVTVYNSNMALVKDTRKIKLSKGVGELRFMDVAAQIMPVTVHIKALNNANHFMVLEQNYEYDLMNANKLLDKYVGKEIKLVTHNQYQDKEEEIEAILLSNNNGQIYKIGDEIHLGHSGYKILPKIPENLIAKPTLSWLYQSQSDQEQDIQVSYLTNNMNWKADYIVVINQEDTMADLSGWVSLDNKSGATYKDAKLKLIAGEVHRVTRGGFQRRAYAKLTLMDSASEMAPQFAEKAFFEYHIYDLQRKTTIKDNQTKQVSLLTADNVNIEKELLVRGQSYYYTGNYRTQELKDPVHVYIKFQNEEENQLGMPLPAGIMRLYKADSQDSLQFIGEDRIEHTPKDEEVKLKIGKAFDVVAERKQLDFKSDGSGSNRVYESEWEITLRNHKDEDITVGVVEPMPMKNWLIINETHDFKKKDAFTVQFDVRVPKDGEVKLKYRVLCSSYKSALDARAWRQQGRDQKIQFKGR